MQVYAAMMDHRIPLGEVGAFAERMESLGFDGIHVPEATHDPSRYRRWRWSIRPA
jgi:hypothetical protein